MKVPTRRSPLLVVAPAVMWMPRADIRMMAERVVVDFTVPTAADLWQPVDDRIMGGSSVSRFMFTPGEGATTFEGNLIVEGGGFASARYAPSIQLPSEVEALALEARGDGRAGYKLTLQSRAAPNGVSYQASLPLATAVTPAGDFERVRLPLAAFRPTFRGQPAPDAPPLRSEDVIGLGLMLSRYEVEGGVKAAIPAGAFCLTLRRLTTAESELAINGRRWAQRAGPPPGDVSRRGAPPAAMCMPRRVHEAYGRDEDRYLWEHQGELERVAEELGRGVKSCEARLERLRNPKSDGHRRLFGVERGEGDEGDDEGAASGGLRCARECVQRIIHDPALDASHFRVGYNDRFRALPMEVPFDQPNDSIRGAERAFVLALPEHRIVYLKYRNRLVWHRPRRLDYIFGSRGGGGVRIQDVVATYSEWERERAARLRRANAHATAALGGSAAALREVKHLLKLSAAGKMGKDDFVEEALSPRYFGRAEGDPSTDAAAALLELIATLPDEHAELREEFLQCVREGAAARGF